MDRVGLLAAGIAMAVALAVVDAQLSDKGLFHEGPPDASPPYLLRSAAIALASALVVVGTRRLVTGLERVPRLISEPSDRSFAMATGVGAAITVGTVLVVVRQPEDVERGRPRGEYLSTLFCFLTSALVVLAAIRSFRSDDRPGRVGLAVALLALGGLFALVGLEEVSCFHHLLDTGSGDLFARNTQDETNLTLLLDGDSMVRSFDDTEVREMMIPLGFLIYALDLVRRSGRPAGSTGRPAMPRSHEQADSPSTR